MIGGALRSLIHLWERRLALRDDGERTVLPFAWGTSHLGNGDLPEREAREFLHRHARQALAGSDVYFDPGAVADFALDGNELTFTSPVATSHPENDRAHAVLFPAPAKGPAVVVLPQWNARAADQVGLCRLLNSHRLTALKLTLPYHGPRMPAGLARAEYILSANVGRTLQACRQAVADARAAISWLAAEGFGPIGLLGTSLGSCIAFIVFAHDERARAAVFNHISPYFADVVWRGISTRHVRQGLAETIELDELRALWLPISPAAYYHRLEGGVRRSLLVYALADLTFPLDLSLELVAEFERRRIPFEKLALPCGHYTTAKFPFNWIDGLAMSRFLSRQLLAAAQKK